MRTKILLSAILAGIGVAWPSPASAQVQQAWAIPFTNGTPTALKLDGSGNVFVTGAGGTTKFDANGNSLWKITNGGVALALDAAYNVYLTGSSPGTNRFTDYLTTKLGPNGQLVWSVRYNGTGNRDDKPVGIAVDSAGNVYVSGSSTSTNYHLICSGIVPCYTNYDTDFATVKYDANGNQLWVACYDGPDKRSDFPSKMQMDPTGNVYVTGISDAGDCNTFGAICVSTMATVKYDSSGNQLWVARYAGPGLDDDHDDEASDLAVDSAGNVHVTGYSFSPGAGYDYLTVKYDSNGNSLWIDRYNSAGNEPDDFLSYRDLAYAVAVGGAGCVYVSGEILGESSSWDFATIKYDANGNQLWLARYHAPTDESSTALAIALDSADNVYVAGFTGATGGSGAGGDILTIKYDANGNQRWAARYRCNARPNFSAHGVTLDASGNVYVIGECAIIKYVQTEPPGLPTITAPPQSQFVPPGANVTFSASAIGKAPLSYQWRLNGTNLPGATLSTLTLTNVRSGGDYSVVVSNTVGLTISPEATLHVSNPPLEEALDTSALFWITYGQDFWFKQNGQTHDGEDAAQSGFAYGGLGSWLQTTVAGPGTLTFWWKISGNADRTGTNYLIFYIDEVPQASIFGEVNWEQKSFDIPAGRHVLKWLYLGNTTVFTGHENAGWVDEVAFTSAPTLVSPVLTTDGQFHVTLVGKAGRSSTIQASTNLVIWTAVTNFVSATGTNQFTDPSTSIFNRRFYRAVSP